LSIYALIPAAGSGSRVAGAEPKQYRALAGRPMLWHAIRAVCVPRVQSVFVVLAENDTLFARHDWSAFNGRLEPLYCGGASRRDSVYNGLVATSGELDPDDWLLVHDAARPCLATQDLHNLIRECEGDAIGGLLALPAADTVKRAAKDEAGTMRVAATLDRGQLWLAQTPQMFRAGLLAQALRSAPPGVTDEAAAVEALGLKPRLVAGSRDNLKVTYPEDFAVAESILSRRA
jgi:2-C-methyl-D-erythritol 4-phosphate cytidylyltransferase